MSKTNQDSVFELLAKAGTLSAEQIAVRLDLPVEEVVLSLEALEVERLITNRMDPWMKSMLIPKEQVPWGLTDLFKS